MTKTRVLVGVGVLVLVLTVGVVLAYPAWSARQGQDATWVVDSEATVLLDHDADRLLVVAGDSLEVLDRATGDRRTLGFAGYDIRAALVPGGVVFSDAGVVRLVPDGTDPGSEWTVEPGEDEDVVHTLVSVDLEAGVAVAAVAPELNTGPSTLTAFALADGAPVWTMEDIARIGTLRMGTDPARPPGELLANTLIPVIRVGGYPPGAAAEPATWSLVDAATGEAATELVQDGEAGMPVAVGDVALQSGVPTCADVTIIDGPDVRWPADPPAGECALVWTLDADRALFTSWRDQNATSGGDDGVFLYSLALTTGVVTQLDWTGTYADTIVEGHDSELARSWGRYLLSRDTVYDTETGAEKWRGAEVWLGGDTAVVAEPVTGIDRIASGADDDHRWVRLADPATGEPRDGGYIAGGITDLHVLDRGQAVVFTGSEVALLG